MCKVTPTHSIEEAVTAGATSFLITQSGFIDPSVRVSAYPKRNIVCISSPEEGRKEDEDMSKRFRFRRIKASLLDEVIDSAVSLLPSQTILLTGCSGKKQEGATCEAQDLYKSTRISFCKRIAGEKNVPLFILSAKYGLISGDRQISDYDKIMTEERAKELIDEVTQQLRLSNIKSIVFFCAGVNKHYRELMSMACSTMGVDLTLIGSGCMAGAKELPMLIDEMKDKVVFSEGRLF